MKAQDNLRIFGTITKLPDAIETSTPTAPKTRYVRRVSLSESYATSLSSIMARHIYGETTTEKMMRAYLSSCGLTTYGVSNVIKDCSFIDDILVSSQSEVFRAIYKEVNWADPDKIDYDFIYDTRTYSASGFLGGI